MRTHYLLFLYGATALTFPTFGRAVRPAVRAQPVAPENPATQRDAAYESYCEDPSHLFEEGMECDVSQVQCGVSEPSALCSELVPWLQDIALQAAAKEQGWSQSWPDQGWQAWPDQGWTRSAY